VIRPGRQLVPRRYGGVGEAVGVGGPGRAGHAAWFGFGAPGAVALVGPLDIDIRPEGTGLPPGRGVAADGAATYRRHCASCHGAAGEGGRANPLVGREPEPQTIGSYWPYATTVFDYIRRAMPTTAPGSLTDDEVYGLTAWLLARNGIIGDDTVLDATSLPRVEMPARDRFVPDDRLETTAVR